MFRFKVVGHVPPARRAHGAMWGDPAEAARLIALRQAAVLAFNGAPPLVDEIGVNLAIVFGGAEGRQDTELHAYGAGLCDGLMAAPGRIKVHESLTNPGLAAIAPTKPIALLDDSGLAAIAIARRIAPDDLPSFEVELRGA
ncbi:MAG: hypothetical protein FJX47_17460 [Alphaproteobacteria bacterium]|nr:hypothetical protein [Alphaproteobacteria bacterium]